MMRRYERDMYERLLAEKDSQIHLLRGLLQNSMYVPQAAPQEVADPEAEEVRMRILGITEEEDDLEWALLNERISKAEYDIAVTALRNQNADIEDLI